MKAKKITSLALSAVMAAGAMSGMATTVMADEEQTLKLAVVETAYGQDMWKNVCAKFEEANPGVKVELTIDKKLEDIITPAMKSGDYPDVIMRAVGSESALTETFVKDNNVEEMTDVLEMTVPGEDVTVKDKILPGFVDNSITNPYGDGKTYLMPMFYGPCGLFYNKGLFEEKGWEVPETWDEMWELGEKAKEEDIALFTYPTAGYFDAFFYALLHETAGAETFQEALKYGEGVWETDGAKKTFEIIEKLASYTEKTTPANANDNDFRKNQQLILDNKALFMPNGNWVIGEMAASTPADYEWGMMGVPKWSEDESQSVYTFTEQMWVPADAPNMDLAKEFVKFMYSDEVVDICLNNKTTDKESGKESDTPVVVPVKGAADKLPDGVTKDCYAAATADDVVAVTGKWATTAPIEGLDMAKAVYGPIESINTGDMTVDEWQKQLVETWEKCADALEK